MTGPVIAAIVIVVVVVIVLGGATAVLRSRRRAVPVPEAVAKPEPTPMSGLEDALNAVTDRSGRPLGERLDAESAHVDEFRIPDDTGPLLRRALDHVAPGESAAETAPVDEPDADTADPS